MTYVTAVPGLCWELAASSQPATHTFCSRTNTHFGGAGEGCYARRGETAGGPSSPRCPPAPRTALRSGSPAGKSRGRAADAPGEPSSRGSARSRPAQRSGARGGGRGQSRGLPGRACRTAGCGERAAAPAGATIGRRELRGGRRGSCAAETTGAGLVHGEVCPPHRTVFCSRNSLERRQWSGMFTAGGKTISNSSGVMCHPNVTGKLT